MYDVFCVDFDKSETVTMSSSLTMATLKLLPYKSECMMSSMFTTAMPKLSGYRSERRDIACRGVLWLSGLLLAVGR